MLVFRSRSQAGFTLLEFLMILAIVVILLIIFALKLSQEYIPRARDTERKVSLEKIKTAFEDYYNDNACYPDPEILLECGSEGFEPYLEKIPCDPETREPYFYEPDRLNQCSGYRLLTQLRYESDPEIVEMPCYEPYNYGVSAGLRLVPEDCLVGPSPSPGGPVPSPTYIPPTGSYDGPYACDARGECNVYADPQGSGCPNSYATVAACNAGCLNPANYCRGGD